MDRGLSPDEATEHVTRLIDPQRFAAAQQEREQAQRLGRVSEMGIGERAAEGAAGLGEAALDIGRGAKQLVTHPIQTAQALVRDPLALVREPVKALASGDPREAARAVGNLGSLALPFARTSRAAGAPTIAQVTSRAVALPFRSLGAVMDIPILRAQAMRQGAARGAQRPQPSAQRPAQPARPEHFVGDAVDDIAQAQRDFAAGRISQADFATAMEVAGQEIRGGGAAPRPTPRPAPDPLETPTFLRRRAAAQSSVPETEVVARSLERVPTMRQVVPRPGEAAPAGGRFVEPGPYQKAGPPVRAASPRAPSDLGQRQMGLILEERRGVSRGELPARLQSLRDLGVLTQQQFEEILRAAQ